jgi:hypothetical protein
VSKKAITRGENVFPGATAGEFGLAADHGIKNALMLGSNVRRGQQTLGVDLPDT